MYIMYSLLCCHTGKRIHNMGVLGVGVCVLCCHTGKRIHNMDVLGIGACALCCRVGRRRLWRMLDFVCGVG